MFRKYGLAVLILIAGLAGSSGAWAGISDGLVGYWNFDNCDGLDSSGNKLDGTKDGSPSCVTGISGKALKFNGTTDQVRVPNPFIGRLKVLSDAYSISFWVKSSTTKSAMSLISSHNACDNIDHTGILIDAYYGGTNGTNGNTIGFRPVDGWLSGASINSSGVFDGNWHHFVASYYDGIASISIDGVLKNSSSPVGSGSSPWKFHSEMVIGGINASACGDFHFDGEIDEVRAYNRALSSAEVQQLASGATGTCDTTTPYDQGYAAAQAACKANPSACGITVSTSPTTTSGHATYSPTANTVHMPFLDVPTIFGGASSVYEVDLTVIPNTNPLQLKLQSAKQVQ
jgi:hypothetical protein